MNNVLLNIDKHATTFTYFDRQQLVLNVGYETVIQRHFKHNLPTPYEIEMAIISIEDAIEAVHKHWQPIESVSTDDKQLELIKQLALGDKTLEAYQLENLFNRVADVIAGSPKQENEFPDSSVFVATLLIVRELVHHLGIKRIEIR